MIFELKKKIKMAVYERMNIMGEEGFEYGIGDLFYKDSKGKMVKFDHLGTAEFAPNTEHSNNAGENVTWATDLHKPMAFEGTLKLVNRFPYFILAFGGNKRMIRRAIRWLEKIRRAKVKGEIAPESKDDRFLAAEFARNLGNNGKRRHRNALREWHFVLVEDKDAT